MTKYNAYATSFIIQSAILCPVCVLAVVLRFMARARIGAGYGAEDWFAVLALLFYFVFIAMCLWLGQHGGGYPYAELPESVLVAYAKAIYASVFFPPISMAAAKFSILFLYNRVFSVSRSFALAVKIAGLINLLWMIAAVIGNALQCVPVASIWDPLLQGSCINFNAFVVGIEVPNSLLDFLIVALPSGMLRRLQMRMRDRIVLILIFAMGGFVGIIGFIRIAVTYDPDNFSDQAEAIWISIQLTFAIICCCVPTYRPLFQDVSFIASIKSYFSSRSKRGDRGSSSWSEETRVSGRYAVGGNERKYNGFNDSRDGQQEEHVLTNVDAASTEGNKTGPQPDGYPLTTVPTGEETSMV